MSFLRSRVLNYFFAVVTALAVVGCTEKQEPATVPTDATPLGTPQADQGDANAGKVNLPTE